VPTARHYKLLAAVGLLLGLLVWLHILDPPDLGSVAAAPDPADAVVPGAAAPAGAPNYVVGLPGVAAAAALQLVTLVQLLQLLYQLLNM
jgi:hypothetical protein